MTLSSISAECRSTEDQYGVEWYRCRKEADNNGNDKV